MSDSATRIRFAEAMTEALRLEFGRDPRAAYLAVDEDDPLSAELAAVVGPERILQEPAGERTLIGRAVGAALEGYLPVCRLSAADLPRRGLDQLVTARELHVAEGLATPLTVLVQRPVPERRSPGSDVDAPERWLVPAAVPTVSPSSASDAKGLVAGALRDPGPVCVVVDERLGPSSEQVPEGGHVLAVDRARVVRTGAQLTVVAHGAAVAPAERLAKELSLDIEILDLRSIVPLDRETIIASVQRTSRIVVFEPTFHPSPVGDAVVSAVVEAAFEYLDAPPVQLAMGSGADAVLREALRELVGY